MHARNEMNLELIQITLYLVREAVEDLQTLKQTSCSGSASCVEMQVVWVTIKEIVV